MKFMCKACGEEFDTLRGLGVHIRHQHYSDTQGPKEFYDKYLKTDPREGFCRNCGKPTRFVKFSKGYKLYCSTKCAQNDPNLRKEFEDTCEKKYGTGIKNPMQSKEVLESYLSRNGEDYYKKNSILGIEANKKKYSGRGFSNPFADPDIVKKIQDTNLKRYGVKYATCLKEYSNKAKETNLKLYNTTTPQLSNGSRKNKPEAKLEEFLKNRGFSYKYQYNVNGKCFDFAIFKDNKLSILVELDGEFYHGMLCDSDGRHVNGDKDHERFYLTPDNVKFIACDAKNLEKCFAEILKVYDIDYESWISDIVNSMPKDFPYPNFDDNRMRKDYEFLKTKQYNRRSQVGMSIVKNFHRSIFSARKNGRISPIECWKDKDKLERVVRNRFIYKSVLSSHNIAQGFSICGIAKTVSVFNPALARFLVQEYLTEFSVVFDPFSGFSGRMLGTCASGKRYIGKDINETHVAESKRIIDFLNLDAEICTADIFSYNGEYECLFTCPPYNRKEIWNDTDVDHSCDEWIDICISRFKCKRYLFVVDRTEKYLANVVYTIDNTNHFGGSLEYVLRIER